MTASSSDFPLPFAPRAVQDTETLQQLGFLPGLKELLLVRQVHALEHATVTVLEAAAQTAADRQRLASVSGLSTDRGFYLYGAVESGEVRRAAQQAQQRLIAGEWQLAVHPRCGTNLSVGMALTLGLGAGMSLFLPKHPLGQAMGFGVAAIAASALAPDLGKLAQQYLTTAIPFNLGIDEITASRDRLGQPVHFVRIHWVDIEAVL